MKKIGIIGAMAEEVSMLIDRINDPKVTEKAGMKFTEGKLLEKEVVIVNSGIGKVNAALAAQVLVDLFDVDAIINSGVAGAISNRLSIGDIVLSEDAVQHDMDASYFGDPVGNIPRMKESYFKGDKKLIKLAEEVCAEVNPEIHVFAGRVASGDQFVSSAEKKHWLATTFNAMCTEMEGAAIAQAAYLNNTPFLVIRAISDKADGSATMDYNTFEKQAIMHTDKLVMGMLERL
jgi:adenosylhomocysteine nucleosidase